MRLSEALRSRGAPDAGPAGPAGPRVAGAPARAGGPEPLAPATLLEPLKRRAEAALFARLGARPAGESLDEEQLRAFVVGELATVLADERVPLGSAERDRLVGDLTTELLGYGPIDELLADPSVTEVMVNAGRAVYVERGGRLCRAEARFASGEQVRRVIERIVGRVGRRIDEASPMVDARLPDGSRVNAVIPPLAIDGPSLTIRKFSDDGLDCASLVRLGTLTESAATFLEACVRGRVNILVSGGTGSGKTTLLNALSAFVPEDERIVTIEDAAELRLRQEHVVRLESRPPNVEGTGCVTVRDLVRNALRMRPDRIIVGEVRGGEALDMLQAMSTGHDGSLSTLHASSPRDALRRVETMVLMAGLDLPVRAVRDQAASAVDVVVHVARLRDGTRRVTHVTEVEGMEGEVVTLTDLFTFDFHAGCDDDGRFVGALHPTGLRPKVADRLHDAGVDLPAGCFGDSAAAGARRVRR